jgi:hypothetical protein
MKPVNTHKRGLVPVLLTTAIVLIAIAVVAVQGSARNSNTISVTINNNTQRSIERLYVATGDPDNWGPDQLNGSSIPSGGSSVLNNVACTGSTARVIAEDKNGCFVYYDVSCGANQTWNISSEATPDCGGN